MAKSYRNANIRVSSENETNDDGLKLYMFTDIENILKDWSETSGFTYWFIEHEADDEVSMTHWHMVIKFKSPMPFAPIKSRFPYGLIENTKNMKNSIQYLIHLNDKSKKQYAWGDICTNCLDMTPYKVQTSSQQEVTLQGVMESIDSGTTREYNQFEVIPIELWSKYKTRIENALTYTRERICMDKNRAIEVIFISGATGLGKTTFAKEYCVGLHKRPCVSSSSNDPLQDYKGEPVLILDDLRDDSFKFHDFLKLLDTHTLSSSRSRYHNKPFIGDTIIITSTKPLSDWYFNESSEDKHQLYRRIRQMVKFTPDKIFAFEYDDKLCRYIPAGSSINYITMRAKERAKLAVKLFDAVGVEFTPADKKVIQDAIENYTDDEWNKVEKEEIEEATEAEKKARKAYEDSLSPIDEKKIAKHRVG